MAKPIERNGNGRWEIHPTIAWGTLLLLVALASSFLTFLFADSRAEATVADFRAQVEETYVRKDVIEVQLQRLTEAINLLRREIEANKGGGDS